MSYLRSRDNGSTNGTTELSVPQQSARLLLRMFVDLRVAVLLVVLAQVEHSPVAAGSRRDVQMEFNARFQTEFFVALACSEIWLTFFDAYSQIYIRGLVRWLVG